MKSQNSKNKKCSIENCNKPHYAKTWCRIHYSRWLRTGNTERHYQPDKNNREYIYKGVPVGSRRGYQLMTKYKITLEEFNSRSINGCEICGDKPEVNLEVDHDHNCCNKTITCGECVRGIICPKCNVNVHKYEINVMRSDNPKINMIRKYLEGYRAKR